MEREIPLREEYAPLIGKHVLLGLTASSSIYRSIDLARKLIRIGAEVKAILTREAEKLISPVLLEWATGSKPCTEEACWGKHVELAEWGDVLVIAPVTLNTMSRIASGATDQLLYLTAASMQGLGKKVIMLPTMHLSLYKSPQYRVIHERLVETGIAIIEPHIAEGKAKYPPINDVAHCIDAVTARGKDLGGKRILVTAGATREYMDPVRFISNPSSGLMGILVAREAACRGGKTTLVLGAATLPPPYNVRTINVETTSEMYMAIHGLTSKEKYDAAVFAAAPSDFRPLVKSQRKIPSRTREGLILRLKPTQKTVKAFHGEGALKIVFAAETVDTYGELVEAARRKMKDYSAGIVLAHRVAKGLGFTSNYIDACIIMSDRHECLGTVRKEVVARRIVDIISGSRA